MKKLIIVYNPRSSQFGRVRDEVLAPSRKLKGWMVGKFEVEDTDVDANAAKLAKMLDDGDLVVSAGGDGTATIALNGAMLAKAKDVKLGVLPYGNFNDMARSFGMMNFGEAIAIVNGDGGGRVAEAWGLECLVDGKRWRWGMGYFTIGMFAEATEEFDNAKHRAKLQTGRKSVAFSWRILVRWYFKNRKRVFIPKFKLNGCDVAEDVTDYVALNGKSMAQVMRGGKWYLGAETFLGVQGRLRSLWRLMVLMGRSVLRRVPGTETKGDVLELLEVGDVEIQAEGEYRKFEKVKTVEIRKAKKPIKVVLKG